MIFFVTVQDGGKTGEKAGIKLAYKHAFPSVFTSDVLNSYVFHKFIHHPPMADLKRLDFRRLFLFEDFPYTVFYIINRGRVNIFSQIYFIQYFPIFFRAAESDS